MNSTLHLIRTDGDIASLLRSLVVRENAFCGREEFEVTDRKNSIFCFFFFFVVKS